MTISEIARLWREDKKQYVKQSTISAYSLLLENHLIPAFGESQQIEEHELQEFVLTKLDDGQSVKYIKDMLIVLKMILRYGEKNRWLEESKFEVKFPTERRRKDLAVLSRAEHRKILQYIHKNFTFRNLGIYITLNIGLRIGEICALRWSDIDVERGVIKIQKTLQRIYIIEGESRRTELIMESPKTKNSIRDIPMPQELQRLVKRLKPIINNEYYVITNSTKPLEPRSYRNYYKQFMKELGVSELKFHGLRHSFATRCIESKCDYKTVSVLLGHSNISTTLNLYVHPNMEQKRRCVDQMLKSLRV